MQLYSFFNSSTSYRVRIALALKGLEVDYHGVNIRVGAHQDAGYVRDVNASAAVPALVDGEFALGQSLAILDYLEQTHPEPPLLPADVQQRARVLELASVIATDMHPVNNLRVLKYLQTQLQASGEQKDAWYRHWIAEGFAAVERLLAAHGHGDWCFGAAPTWADVCLVPQVANALRAGCDLSAYTQVMRIYALANQHPAFIAAQPSRQADFQA